MTNVLLISFDTLRSDVAYSGKFPTINRILERGTSFSTAVASAPLTPLSHATVFSGLQPPNHGLRHLFRQKIDENVPLLAENMIKAGYRTGAFASCPGLNSWYGFDRGFENYDDEVPLLPDGTDPLKTIDVKLRGIALKRADVVADRAIQWLKDVPNEEFFLFVHFFDSHWPYEAPEDYGVKIDNAYEGEVAYMDYHLGRLLDHIEAEGLDEDLAIVFFSDHGEDLAGWYPNDKAGDRGHPEESGHGSLLFDQTQLVALSVSWPGHIPQGKWVSDQARLVDIAPTIYDLSKLNTPKNLDGESLIPMINGEEKGHRPAYFESFYREEKKDANGERGGYVPLAGLRIDDRWKVLWDQPSLTAGVRVYDLQNDPGEWQPELSIKTELAPIPKFDPEHFDRSAFNKAMMHSEKFMTSSVAFMAVIEAIAKREELGIKLCGELVNGNHKPTTPACIEITFPLSTPNSNDIDWLKQSISNVTDVLAVAPSKRTELPAMWHFLCETPNGSFQIDIICRGPADPVMNDLKAIVFREAAGRMPTVRRHIAQEFDVSAAWGKFWIWSWNYATKIKSDELVLASGFAANIMHDILMPTLASAAKIEGLKQGNPPSELPDQIKANLANCMPKAFDKNAYTDALMALIDYTKEELIGLADSQGINLQNEDGIKLRSHIDNLLTSELKS